MLWEERCCRKEVETRTLTAQGSGWERQTKISSFGRRGLQPGNGAVFWGPSSELGLVWGACGKESSSGSGYSAGLFAAVSRDVKCPEIQKRWQGGMLSSNLSPK